MLNDNSKRGIRTAFQALLGFIASGGLDLIWKNFLSNHDAHIDPTLLLVIGLVLTGVASWAVNAIEDKTGKGLFVPDDRAIGDVALGTGIGKRQA